LLVLEEAAASKVWLIPGPGNPLTARVAQLAKAAASRKDSDMLSAGDESLSRQDFQRLRALILAEAGIQLSEDKRTMLEVRIKRRLRHLGMHSYGEYCAYLLSREGRREEMVSFIDVVTTNKTDFFREPRHFDFLRECALLEMEERSAGRHALVWSAGCSSGEEPYTLAMVLSEYAALHPGFRFRILATDISTQMLEKAQRAIYTEDQIAPVPKHLRHKYMLRSRNRSSELVKMAPEVRSLVEFQRLNFMEAQYTVCERADAIFCRNVLIYFNRQIQQEILLKLCRHLVPGGYLFVGHSESLHDMALPVTPVAPALYRRTNAT
jgi:chemotaxis protein methyltransferase CheR